MSNVRSGFCYSDKKSDLEKIGLAFRAQERGPKRALDAGTREVNEEAGS